MSKAEPAVIFDDHDYASGVRRVISALIDLVVSFVLLSLPIAVGSVLWVPPEVRALEDVAKQQRLTYEAFGPARYYATFTLALLLPVVYHAAMRMTPVGTLGYILTGIRLVGPDGRRPPFGRILKRMALSLIGFVTFGAIFFPCFKRRRKQAVHDMFAGTWLVRRGARSGRPGRLVYKTRLLGTYPLTHADVEGMEEEADAMASPAEPGAGEFLTGASSRVDF